MKNRFYIFGTFLILSVLYITGCRKAGLWLVKKDEIVHADAIVILMGSIADRLLQTVDLYEDGVSDRVIIVEGGLGAYKQLRERGADIINFTEQVRDAAIDLGIAKDDIIVLPGNAQSTHNEAMKVSDYIMENPGVDTLLLVSSAHHTRRAHMIFKTVFAHSTIPIYIECYPSSYSAFHPEKWWRSKDDIETVLLEYLKLMNFIMFERRELKEVDGI